MAPYADKIEPHVVACGGNLLLVAACAARLLSVGLVVLGFTLACKEFRDHREQLPRAQDDQVAVHVVRSVQRMRYNVKMQTCFNLWFLLERGSACRSAWKLMFAACGGSSGYWNCCSVRRTAFSGVSFFVGGFTLFRSRQQGAAHKNGGLLTIWWNGSGLLKLSMQACFP